MNCSDAHPLLEAHADGELDLLRQVALEAHLDACPACALLAKAAQARREALRQGLARFPAPQSLRLQVEAMARGACPAPAAASLRAPSWQRLWNLGGLAAALALTLLGGYAWGKGRARGSALVDEAVSVHVRSLQAAHLMDVVSTDQHTVKPWFVGRIDFSPPVVDLVDLGFPLAGGRLERMDGRAAAALVFHRRQHVINLLIWPAGAGSLPERRGAENGYNAASWSSGDLNFLAVSEIPEPELAQFIEDFRARTRP